MNECEYSPIYPCPCQLRPKRAGGRRQRPVCGERAVVTWCGVSNVSGNVGWQVIWVFGGVWLEGSSDRRAEDTRFSCFHYENACLSLPAVPHTPPPSSITAPRDFPSSWPPATPAADPTLVGPQVPSFTGWGVHTPGAWANLTSSLPSVLQCWPLYPTPFSPSHRKVSGNSMDARRYQGSGRSFPSARSPLRMDGASRIFPGASGIGTCSCLQQCSATTPGSTTAICPSRTNV
ncbi:hypothetical protein FA13DRAFT_156155 [Coprinellus micaceus]|uniref:Uncharacterized protein n=1 Tax=Coprinellus micaceus TaxID=71717 RepID=A0A4Y7TH24_COPMI|nr:hypothetical protein FA13DRAFT_156155 [Coprinellus micaceus]